MSEKSQDHRSGDPSNNPELWKVEPGFALGILQLGTPRDELFKILRDRNFDMEDIEGQETELYVIEMDTTLYFATEHPHPLELIEVDDERARFGTLKVLGDYPHNVFASIPSTRTLWFEDLSHLTSGYTARMPKSTVTDESLLDGGTLWMPELGFGFRLSNGKVSTLLLCDPSKLPKVGDGEFTGKQRHLSERMQSESFKTPQVKSQPFESLVKIALLLIALSVAAFFGKQAWDEQQQWNNSVEVEAEVVAVSPPPPEPFPNQYHLAYQDESGIKREIDMGQNDIFGIPRVGDKVTLHYLSGSPESVKGPAKIHDVVMEKYAPYFISTFAIYLVIHFMSDFILGLLFKSPRGRKQEAGTTVAS